MNDDIKGDNITDENADIVKKGDDFSNCKVIHSKQLKVKVTYLI